MLAALSLAWLGFSSADRAFSWLATQGPWAEKWNRTDEVEDGNLVEIESAGDEITESIGFVMDRRMLLGIKARAELVRSAR